MYFDVRYAPTTEVDRLRAHDSMSDLQLHPFTGTGYLPSAWKIDRSFSDVFD